MNEFQKEHIIIATQRRVLTAIDSLFPSSENCIGVETSWLHYLEVIDGKYEKIFNSLKIDAKK